MIIKWLGFSEKRGFFEIGRYQWEATGEPLIFNAQKLSA
jgi:hypothetical protein